MDEYVDIVTQVEECAPKIDGYEINISCPNVDRGGMEFGVSRELTLQLTKRLRALTERFLIIKLSPNVTAIEEIARAAESGGADAVSAMNTVVAMGIDPKTGRFAVSKGLGGLSGPAIRPIALAAVYKVARAVNIPVIGIGGIMDAGDVVSFLRAGALAVQIGTANYRDPGIGVKIVADLEDYLSELEVQDLSAIRGDAHP
jgi:dihydroorotate dehydrogenase (NAD+) catalytic subunit